MQTLNASDVRKHFSEVIDSVIREKPIAIRRHRDYILTASIDQVKLLLDGYRFKATIGDSGANTLMGKFEGFDLIVEGNTKEEVIHNLASDILEYAEDYFKDFNLYFNSTNRKNHYPYVLKVLLADSIKEIETYIDA